jgi:hypothetical protein
LAQTKGRPARKLLGKVYSLIIEKRWLFLLLSVVMVCNLEGSSLEDEFHSAKG